MDSSNANVQSIVDAETLATFRNSVTLQIYIAFLVICLSTRVLSFHWFNQTKRSHTGNVTPPTIPYWIPFLRHAFSMAWDTKRFAARCL